MDEFGLKTANPYIQKQRYGTLPYRCFFVLIGQGMFFTGIKENYAKISRIAKNELFMSFSPQQR